MPTSSSRCAMAILSKQLHERLELAEQDKRNAVALAKAQVANALQKAAAAKDAEIQALKGAAGCGRGGAQAGRGTGAGRGEQSSAMRWPMSWSVRGRRSQAAEPSWPKPAGAGAAGPRPPRRTPKFRPCKAKLEAGEVARQLAGGEPRPWAWWPAARPRRRD
jgi:hypothetical protein